MADVPQTLALTTLAQNFPGDVVRQINRKAMALRVLPIIVGEGKNCAWAPESDGALAEEYAEGADATDFGSDDQASAILDWTQLRATSRITGLAMAASRTSRTPQGNLSLVMRGVANSAAALASVINQQIHSGNGSASPRQITGLATAIGDDSNVYATINRATGGNEYFQPTVVDPGSPDTLTFAKIRDDLGRIYDKCGEVPGVAFCSSAVYNTVGNLFQGNRNYVDVLNLARGEIKLDAGFRGLEVDGCVFLKDKDVPAGTIEYVNTNYVHVEVLPPSNEAAPVIEPGTMLTSNDGFGDLPLMISYEKLAKTGDSTKYQAKVYIQLVVTRPNACGVRKNVAVTA